MRAILVRFLLDQSGSTALEYALIGSIVSIAIIAGAIALGNKLNNSFSFFAGKFS
ncbi:hypothetical protein BH10PSE9_BH10PSE9_08360 [soil metagenome]